MQIFDNLLGQWQLCPRSGKSIEEQKLPLSRIAEIVAPFLPRTEPQGSGALDDMFAFGERAWLYGSERDGVVVALEVQVLHAATREEREKAAGVLGALGALDLVLREDGIAGKHDVDLADPAAVRRFAGLY